MWGSCQEWQNPNPRWGRVRPGWLLNKGAGLWHQHSTTYNAVLRSLPRHLHSCSHLVSGDLSRLHDRVGRGLMVVSLETSGGNDPHLVLQSHVTSYMINSGSTTLSKHNGHQGLNTWGSPAVGFRTEEGWIRGEYLPVAFFQSLKNTMAWMTEDLHKHVKACSAFHNMSHSMLKDTLASRQKQPGRTTNLSISSWSARPPELLPPTAVLLLQGRSAGQKEILSQASHSYSIPSQLI